MNNIDNFIDYIAGKYTPDEKSINIYAGNSKEAEVKRIFLSFYLNKMKRLKPTRIFIGEAPGHNGCFNTGVPFTDEFTIANNSFFAEIKTVLSVDRPQIERTASIIWKCLSTIPTKEYPLMWNIYPFHPSYVDSSHLLAKERKNRKPNSKECICGIDILKELIGCFDSITHFYVIGRVPEKSLKKIYENICYIRHPSCGGANIFRGTFNTIFDIEQCKLDR